MGQQMDLIPRCGQSGCEQPAAWRYEWLGEPMLTCEQHRPKLQSIAEAVGVRVNLQPVGGRTRAQAPLRDALPEIHAALERMLAKPREVMPFVRVEISEDDPRFVQFAGAAGCPLFFDSPPLMIFAHEVGFGLPGLKGTPTEIGAELAILGLRDQGVADDDLVVIVEQNTRGGGNGAR